VKFSDEQFKYSDSTLPSEKITNTASIITRNCRTVTEIAKGEYLMDGFELYATTGYPGEGEVRPDKSET